MAPSNNKDIEIGSDEQKTFEVIDEHKETKEFETPHMVRRGLTEVSAMFDRNGKGYLDETERALRRMDSQNKGHLGIDKVCVIFESLQAEQERSAELLESLRVESKKAMSLKRGVIALSVFAVLLAVANIGTSFAVSQLVKEVKVGPNGDLVALDSGNRLGTTSKLEVFDMEDLEEVDVDRRHRVLQAASSICSTLTTSTGGTTTEIETVCRVQGVMNYNKAMNMHNALQGVNEILLTCNSKRSTVFGGHRLPAGAPGLTSLGDSPYRVFPDATDTNEKYDAVQRVSLGQGLGSPSCDANFQMAMYCPPASLMECFVMTAFLPSATCSIPPEVCGPKPTRKPTSVPLAQPLAGSRGGAGGAASQP